MLLEEQLIYEIIKNIAKPQICVLDNFCIEKIDFLKIKRILIEQKIFHIVYPLIKPIINDSVKNEFKEESIKNEIFSNITLKQIQQIDRIFKKQGIRYAISKGLSTGKLISNNSKIRTSGDIDVIVNSKDYLRCCDIFESLGYIENNFETINKHLPLKLKKEKYFLENSDACVFIRKTSQDIELKDKIQYIPTEKISHWLENTCEMQIDNITFSVFNLYHQFVNIIINSYKNLCTPYGIEYDYTMRDIVEPYIFIVKYKKFLIEKLEDIIGDEILRFRLRALMDIFAEFFDEEGMSYIPEEFKQIPQNVYNFDFMVWETNILDRLFDKHKRIIEHEKFRCQNYTNKTIKKNLKLAGDEKETLSTSFNYSDDFDFKIQSTVNLTKEHVVIKYYIPSSVDDFIISQKFLTNGGEKVTSKIEIFSVKTIFKCVSNHIKCNINIKKGKSYIVELYIDKNQIVNKEDKNYTFYMSSNFYLRGNNKNICVFKFGDEYNLTKYIR